jgi:hypothetical protein
MVATTEFTVDPRDVNVTLDDGAKRFGRGAVQWDAPKAPSWPAS